MLISVELSMKKSFITSGPGYPTYDYILDFLCMPVYTSLTNFSTKYLVVCKVYTDVGGIK